VKFRPKKTHWWHCSRPEILECQHGIRSPIQPAGDEKLPEKWRNFVARQHLFWFFFLMLNSAWAQILPSLRSVQVNRTCKNNTNFILKFLTSGPTPVLFAFRCQSEQLKMHSKSRLIDFIWLYKLIPTQKHLNHFILTKWEESYEEFYFAGNEGKISIKINFWTKKILKIYN